MSKGLVIGLIVTFGVGLASAYVYDRWVKPSVG